MLAGIDYSITSPAVCIHPNQENWEPSKCKFLFFSILKKYKNGDIINDVFRVAKLQPTDIERTKRYGSNARLVVNFLTSYDVSNVAIEGYSFASQSSNLMQMGENGGILRYILNFVQIPYIEPPPSQIKSFATNNGRSDKIAMGEQFEKETGYDLRQIFNRKSYDSNPVSDIADAYFICKFLHSKRDEI